MKMTSWSAVVGQPDQFGESPFWHPQERRLYWVDIPARQIRRVEPCMPAKWKAGPCRMEPGCIAPTRSGGLVIALRDGIYRAHNWGGALSPIAQFGHDVATTRFNDGKADPAGALLGRHHVRAARRAQGRAVFASTCASPAASR